MGLRTVSVTDEPTLLFSGESGRGWVWIENRSGADLRMGPSDDLEYADGITLKDGAIIYASASEDDDFINDAVWAVAAAPGPFDVIVWD